MVLVTTSDKPSQAQTTVVITGSSFIAAQSYTEGFVSVRLEFGDSTVIVEGTAALLEPPLTPSLCGPKTVVCLGAYNENDRVFADEPTLFGTSFNESNVMPSDKIVWAEVQPDPGATLWLSKLVEVGFSYSQ